MSDPTLIVEESRRLRYVLSVPERKPVADGWPLLCFLHGYDEAAPTGIVQGVTRHGPLGSRSSTLVRDRFVVVAPQLPEGGDLWHEWSQDVGEILERVTNAHQVDRTRCYLSGFSFGGNGVFDLALSEPGRWAALWAVDPTRVPARDPELPVWVSIGEVSRRRSKVFMDRLRLSAAEPMLDAERVILDEGKDHVGSAASAYADPRIYDWLLRHRV